MLHGVVLILFERLQWFDVKVGCKKAARGISCSTDSNWVWCSASIIWVDNDLTRLDGDRKGTLDWYFRPWRDIWATDGSSPDRPREEPKQLQHPVAKQSNYAHLEGM